MNRRELIRIIAAGTTTLSLVPALLISCEDNLPDAGDFNNTDNGKLPCPCHGSVYSISGSVLEGPAPAPLKKYNITREGDILTIYLS